MKKRYIDVILIMVIFILFLFTSISPMISGMTNRYYDEEHSAFLDNLRFFAGYDNNNISTSLIIDKYINYMQYFDDSQKSKEGIYLGETFSASLQHGVETQAAQTSNGGPMGSSWSMMCHDTHHTSRSPYSTVNITGLEKWRFRCDGVDASPIIGKDGTIFFGDKDGYVFALHPNGTLKWDYRAVNWEWITSAPALAEDGTLYVTSWDKKLWAFDSQNGTVKWAFNTNYIIATSSPIIGEDGTIYFGTAEGNTVFAVNPNGTEKWRYTLGGDIYSSPAISDDGTIYIGSWDTYFYSINPNGTLKWRFKTGHYIKGPPSIADDGTVYIGSWDDYLYALYPNNGTMKWKCKVGYGTETNPSIASDGTIYVGGDKLWAIYPNGTKRWTFDLGEGRHIHKSCPAISADGTIYVGTNINSVDGGDIIAVNPDGTEKWRKKICNEWCDSSPCIAEDGTVYIGSSDYGGYLHAFGPVETNEPPDKPAITGETKGKTGENYWYTFRVIDPDNNPISWYIEWGDGDTIEWNREWASEENCYYEHTWSKQDNYTIRAKARDVLGEESDWAYLEVSMPVNQPVQFPIINWLLERFPNMFPFFHFLFNC
jgi:outer membrane protein assembly factor BamB